MAWVYDMDIRMLSSPNFTAGRHGWKPDMMVAHTSGNTTQSAINTAMNPANTVSYHDIIAGANFDGRGIVPAYRDGDIIQLVDIRNSAHHAGTSAEVRARSTLAAVRQRTNASPNWYSYGFAFGDMNLNGGRLTEAQIKSAVRIIQHRRAEIKRIYGVDIPLDRNHIVGHNQINTVTRAFCPGNIQWDEIMDGLNIKYESRANEMSETRYNKVSEMPGWAQADIQELIDRGLLRGSDGDASRLNLSLDMIRMLIIENRREAH